jgi:hypothetical protein
VKPPRRYARLCPRQGAPGLRLNEHIEHEDGAIVFRHACKMGLGLCSASGSRDHGSCLLSTTLVKDLLDVSQAAQ